MSGLRHLPDPQEAAEAYVESLDYIEDQHRRMSGEGFLEGVRWLKEAAVTYFHEYRRAYPEDLFTPIEPGEKDPISRDRISGQMGRFLLDNMIREWSSGEFPVKTRDP